MFLLRILGFVVGKFFKVCFGWLDRLITRRDERHFASDIQNHLAFLFTDFGAQIAPTTHRRSPQGFDFGSVQVEVNPLRLKFYRGRGEFWVKVGSEFAPDQWEDYQLVAEDIGKWDPRRTNYDLETFAPILRSHLDHLKQAMSVDNFETTLKTAVRTHNDSVDSYTTKLRESGIGPKIRELKQN